MIFYYVRHGDPIYNPDTLTSLGKRQAEALGHRFAQHGLDRIFSSPSTRAMQTSEPTCEMLKKEKTILDWCDEGLAWEQLTVEKKEENRKTWCYHHKPTRELFALAEIRNLGNEFYKHKAFDDKTVYGKTKFKDGLERIQKEADAFFETLGYRHDHERGGYVAENPSNERVALFAHQGFGLAFLSCVLDIPYPSVCTRFDFGHSGVTVIEFSAEKGDLCIPTVLQWSNDSHLYKDGLGTSYHNRMYI